jgi:hypothetical protein
MLEAVEAVVAKILGEVSADVSALREIANGIPFVGHVLNRSAVLERQALDECSATFVVGVSIHNAIPEPFFSHTARGIIGDGLPVESAGNVASEVLRLFI